MHLFLLITLVVTVNGCGGGANKPDDEPEPDASLEIGQHNYDVVVAYGYAVPESMLQIGQMVESHVAIFTQQQSSIYTGVCSNGGQFEISHEDIDVDGKLSNSDKLSIAFSDCYNDIVESNVRGNINLVIANTIEDNSQYNASISIEIFDNEGTVGLSTEQLAITFEILADREVLTVASAGRPTNLNIDNIAETITAYSIDKTILKQSKEYRINYSFAIDSSALDGEFSCNSLTGFHGYIYSLPLDYDFQCTGKNRISVTNLAGDQPQAYDTDVTINHLDGSTETIGINQDNYMDGSLYSPFSSAQVDYIHNVIEAELPDMGHASFIRVDKQSNIAYLAAMVFGKEYQGIIYKLDLADLGVVETVTLTNRIHRMKLSNDGQKLYVIEEDSKFVRIYNTDNLNDVTSIDMEALGVTGYVSATHIDITPLPSSPSQWLYYYKNSTDSNVLLLDGSNLIDSMAVANSVGTLFGSVFAESDGRFYFMQLTGNMDRQVTINEYAIASNEISLIQQADFNHNTDISGLSDSQYYQIRFLYGGDIYIDGGFVVSAEDLGLKTESGINKPALSEMLGRVYDLNGIPEIKAYSIGDLAELSSMNGFEKPWSRRGYIVEDGNTGFIIMASSDKVYRVGKLLLP